MFVTLLLSASLCADSGATRLLAQPGTPVIDGSLADAVWLAAGCAAGFVQVQPDQGSASSYRTEVRAAVDDANLYVAVRAFDPDPRGILAPLARRDQAATADWIYVGIDSRRDRRTAYVFAVNPAGVKLDYLAADGQSDDYGWDAVWDVRTRIDELGWTAEFRVPAAALRFRAGQDVWGLQVVRVAGRDQEHSAWQGFRRDDPRKVAGYGELHGMAAIAGTRRLEVLPYTVATLTKAPDHPHERLPRTVTWTHTAGADLKYAVTTDLALNVSVNPDFGQVEADPSQVNLTSFERFLPERRPFFVEGADLFRFGIEFDPSAPDRLFYSRRIGRTPQLLDQAGGVRSVSPRQARIPVAAKLTGRLAGGWSVGALTAVTASEIATVYDSSGPVSYPVVEPMTGYGAFRLLRGVNGERTQLGLVATGVTRELDSASAAWLTGSAMAGGADVVHRWGRNEWLAAAYLLGSRVAGSTAAITRTQQSAVRYCQRPDAAHLRVDTSAVSLDGWAASYQVGKVAGRWRGGVAGTARSPGFEVNDLGFLRRSDIAEHVLWAAYRNFRPGRYFRSYGSDIAGWRAHDFGGTALYGGSRVMASGELVNRWNVSSGVTWSPAGMDPRALRGGPGLATPARADGFISLATDRGRSISGHADVMLGHEPDGGGSSSLGVGMRWQPAPATALSLAASHERLRHGWQYVAQPLDGGGQRHYLLGDIDQRTYAAQLRFERAFSTELTLELFARPFISAGRYRSFSEVVAPRARRRADRLRRLPATGLVRAGQTFHADLDGDGTADVRFSNPEFNVRDLNLNAVLRWEYRPGSTLFLVWTHERNAPGADGMLQLGRDLDRLRTAPARNVLMVKATYWWSH